MQIEANFWILTGFWKGFAGNPTRPRKKKQPLKFDPFLNGFSKKSN